MKAKERCNTCVEALRGQSHAGRVGWKEFVTRMISRIRNVLYSSYTMDELGRCDDDKGDYGGINLELGSGIVGFGRANCKASAVFCIQPVRLNYC